MYKHFEAVRNVSTFFDQKKSRRTIDFIKFSLKILLQISGIKKSFIWQGLYLSFDDVKLKKKSWGDGILEKKHSIEIQQYLNQKTRSFIPYQVGEEYCLMPLLVAALTNSKKDFNILDLGGALGISYLHLKQCFVKEIKINYHIVETKSMVDFSKKLTYDNNEIYFHTVVPIALRVDLIYISSSLQYIEFYEKVLKTLSDLNSSYIFFVKLSAGEFKTYYTRQINESSCEMKYIFYNVHEIINIMKLNGYSLIYKSVLQRKYDQQNFPKELRMNKTCNLLFQKDESK